MPKTNAIVPLERIESRILLIRGHKVMLDSDLAELYGVTTKRLNEQVKRNRQRFPADFMFQLTSDEATNLRSRIATSKQGRGGRRYRPYAFTEHGAIMAASVLNSYRAIEVSIYVARAFVKLREMLRTHKELARKLAELEKRIGFHG
jgi:aromatic ring-opening dioxygenase LigB subunit